MKISFSGTHGTGKSTAVFALAAELKLNNPNKTVGVFMENAKHSPLGFNKNKPLEAQLWIFSNQLQAEIDLSTKYDILITDRTIFDSIAYAKYFGYADLAAKLFKVAAIYVGSYNKIIIKTIKSNSFWFPDGIRDVEDEIYRQQIEKELFLMYDELKRKGAKFEFVVV